MTWETSSYCPRFHKTEITKRYVCLVHGRVAQAKGLVDAHIRTLRTDATTRPRCQVEVLSVWKFDF